MLVLVDLSSCALIESLEADLELGHLLAAHHFAILTIIFSSNFLDFEALLEQVDGAFGAVEHFFLSLSQLRDESVLGLHRVEFTFLLA